MATDLCHFQVRHITYEDEAIEDSAVCVIDIRSATHSTTYLTIASTILLFIFPLIFLPILFRKIIKALNESQNLMNGGGIPDNHHNLAHVHHRTVVKMQGKQLLEPFTPSFHAKCFGFL